MQPYCCTNPSTAIKEESKAYGPKDTIAIMSATGGLAHEATIFYKCLASLLSTKWGDSYSLTLGWLRCCLSFSLLCLAIACIRGARSPSGHFDRAPPPMDLVRAESHLMV